jgi:hypothetical protein
MRDGVPESFHWDGQLGGRRVSNSLCLTPLSLLD